MPIGTRGQLQEGPREAELVAPGFLMPGAVRCHVLILPGKHRQERRDSFWVVGSITNRPEPAKATAAGDLLGAGAVHPGSFLIPVERRTNRPSDYLKVICL